MRFVALAAIIMCFPAFVAWLRARPHHRPIALTLIAASYFTVGLIQIEASLITWPMWSGPVRGIQLSMIDALGLALIVTRRQKPGAIPYKWVFWAYLIAIALSIIPSVVHMASAFSAYQFARIFLTYIAVAPELMTPLGVMGLIRGFAIGLTIQGGSVLLQKGQGVVQAGGTGFHQNTLGIMVELTLIPIVAAILAGERSKLLKLGAVAGLVVVAGGGSRATMGYAVSGLAVLLVLSLVQRSTPVKWRVLGVGLLAAVLIAPLAIKTMSARFGSNTMLQEDDQRIAMAKAARAMATDHPFGVGANMYTTTGNTGGYSERAGVSWGGNTRGAPVHNSYLLARAETGWHGELAFILWLIVPIIAGLRFAFKARDSIFGSLSLGSAVAIAVMALHVNVEFAAHTYGVQNLITLNFALIAGAYMTQRLRQRAGRRPPPSDADTRAGALPRPPGRSDGGLDDLRGPRRTVRPA